MNEKLGSVRVDDRVANALGRGHPWIFREALRFDKNREAPATGDVVVVAGPKGEHLGIGLYDAESPLAVRLYDRAKGARLDAGWFRSAFARSFAKRSRFGPETTAYRLLNGEGDRVPGFVIDRYEHIAVLRTDGAASATWVSRLTPVLLEALRPLGVTTLLLRSEGDADGRRVTRLGGGDAPDTIDVREHGMVMEVDLAFGQKTGAFLDQRENRRRVREACAGCKRMLNLYSYAGGFSIAAALGGAVHTTSVDIAPKAHASAQRSFRKNGLDVGTHTFVTADVFSFLDAAAAKKDRWDLIVCDPPSFAPNERSKKKALSAYARLHRACAGLLAPGGALAAASCSSHIGMDEFLGTLTDDHTGRSDLSVTEVFGPPSDHPSTAFFSEGRYLKFVWLR